VSRRSARRDENIDRLTELHERVASDLLRFLERQAGSAEDAADLLAETFLVAWQHVSRIPAGDEEARMWMFVTARNVARNWRRSHQRRNDLAISLRDELRAVGTSSAPVSAEVLDIRAAVAGLPRRLREIVILVHWEDFTVPEAASVIRIRESTARGRLQRARIRLRAVLGEREYRHTPERVSSATGT
jgi:RNA polymerase sigma factor (sigma-70 family)